MARQAGSGPKRCFLSCGCWSSELWRLCSSCCWVGATFGTARLLILENRWGVGGRERGKVDRKANCHQGACQSQTQRMHTPFLAHGCTAASSVHIQFALPTRLVQAWWRWCPSGCAWALACMPCTPTPLPWPGLSTTSCQWTGDLEVQERGRGRQGVQQVAAGWGLGVRHLHPVCRQPGARAGVGIHHQG